MSVGRASLFDASALVKVFTDEPGSEIVRHYFNHEPTTPFCFYEALGILKAKWKYGNELTAEKYLEAARRLTAWYGASSRGIDDLDFASHATFNEAKRLAEKTALDLVRELGIFRLQFITVRIQRSCFNNTTHGQTHTPDTGLLDKVGVPTLLIQ